MKTTEGYSQWFVNECARVARAGQARMMRPGGIYDELHLYFRPGELVMLGESDSSVGYELVTSDRVPDDRTVDQLVAWVHRQASRVGCLPVDGERVK